MTLVDATDLRAHLQQLSAWGFSDQAIGLAAGLSNTEVRYVRNGTHARVRDRVHAALRRVGPYPVRQQLVVPNHGTRRRIEALTVLGWPSTQLAADLGVSAAAVRQWRVRPQVTVGTHFGVAEAYARREGTPGPSGFGRDHAVRMGWAPPLAWDDIDHPAAVPWRPRTRADASIVDDVAVERALAGDLTVRLNKAEYSAVVRHALDRGWTSGELARRTGWSIERASQALVRAHRVERAAA